MGRKICKGVWWLLGLLSPTSATIADDYLRLTAGGESVVLRIEVSNQGRSLAELGGTAAYTIFDHCDVDQNGRLELSEAQWLPTPFGVRQLYWGKVLPAVGVPDEFESSWNHEALQGYYCERGVGHPVICYGKSQSSLPLHAALSEIIGLEESDLQVATGLAAPVEMLKRLDRNADLKLSPGELLADVTYPATAASQLLTSRDSRLDSRLDYRDKQPAELLTLSSGISSVSDAAETQRLLSIELAGDQCEGSFVNVSSFEEERDYQTTQLRVRVHVVQQALAGPQWLDRYLADNPAAVATGGRQVTAERLREIVDRNRDGQLQEEEVASWRETHRQLTATLCCISVFDMGQSLFGWLDLNLDGELSFLEIEQAFAVDGSIASLVVDGQLRVPHQFEILVSRERPRSILRRAAEAPGWFAAMDRNHDGLVQRQEFLGAQEVFDRLDLDRDTALSRAEAAATENAFDLE